MICDVGVVRVNEGDNDNDSQQCFVDYRTGQRPGRGTGSADTGDCVRR